MNDAEPGDSPPTPAARSTDRAAQEGVGVVPPGAPRWVTAELIEHTLRVWQPRYCYAERLSASKQARYLLDADRFTVRERWPRRTASPRVAAANRIVVEGSGIRVSA